TIWEACREYAPGEWGRVGGNSTSSHRRIFDTGDDALFQTTLDGIEALRFDVPDGEYEIELRLAETLNARPGQRVFDVSVNGTALCTSLDLASAPGPFTAVVKT